MSRTRGMLATLSLLILMSIATPFALAQEEVAEQIQSDEQRKAAEHEASEKQAKENEQRLAAEREEHERKVKEFERLRAEQNNAQIPVLAVVGVFMVLFVISQAIAYRRGQTLLIEVRKNADIMQAQNIRMIQLLDSIDRRLKPPGP